MNKIDALKLTLSFILWGGFLIGFVQTINLKCDGQPYFVVLVGSLVCLATIYLMWWKK